MIKEVIVVEGKDDVSAVKRAVDAEVIITSGLGLTEKTLERIKSAQERTGVIILTDPDYPGEKIRKIIEERVPGCKHAFLPREKAIKDGDLGVENASPESILEALAKVRTETIDGRSEFTIQDLINHGLTEDKNASQRRDIVGRELGIGYGNSKQFLSRLNRYGVTREEFTNAASKLL